VLDVDNQTGTYTFSKGNVKVEDLLLEATGNIVHKEKENALNIALNGKDMDIQSVLSLVPAKDREKISGYESEGNFYFNATVQGSLSDTRMPVIRAGFGIKDGEIAQSGSPVKLKNVFLTGKYFSGSDAGKPVKGGTAPVRKSALDIDNFSCSLGGGTVTGSFRLDNLEDPFISVRARAGVELAALQQFLKLDTIERVEGQLHLDFSVSGKIMRTETPSVKNVLGIRQDFKISESEGTMSLAHVNAKLKGNPLELKELNGEFKFMNSDMAVNAFSGAVSGSDFDMNGVFRNFVPYVFTQGEDMVVDAAFRAKRIDLNELLSDKSSAPGDSTYRLAFPEHVDVNLNTSIDKVEFRKFEAAGITGGLRIKDKKLIADPISLKTMGGRITTSVMVDASAGSSLLITCDAKLERLDISRVFYQFENFGQDYLVDKNLKGVATATVQFASIWSPSLTIDPDKVYVLCDVTVENGRLIGLKSLSDIAVDMRKDFLMNKLINCDEFEKRLKNVSFPVTTNRVEIKGQTISFAPMTIRSSVLNMEFSGWHKFNNDIEYHFNFPYSALPLRSEEKRKEANKEFGIEEDEANSMELCYLLTGNVDKEIIYKKDKPTHKKVREEKKEKEKQNLRQILKDEFGWFKKDSSLTDKKDPDKKSDKNKEDGKFIIKWDDEKKDGKKEDEED
jgi:hypothetical protein